MGRSRRRGSRRNPAVAVPSPASQPPPPLPSPSPPTPPSPPPQPPNYSLPPSHQTASNPLPAEPEVLVPCTDRQESGFSPAPEPHSGVYPEPENSVLGDDREEAPELDHLAAAQSRLRETIAEPCLQLHEWNKGGQDEAEDRAPEAQCMNVEDHDMIIATESFLWQVKKIRHTQMEMALRVPQYDVKSQSGEATFKALQDSYRVVSQLLPEKLPAPGRPSTPRIEELERIYSELHISGCREQARKRVLEIFDDAEELRKERSKERERHRCRGDTSEKKEGEDSDPGNTSNDGRTMMDQMPACFNWPWNLKT